MKYNNWFTYYLVLIAIAFSLESTAQKSKCVAEFDFTNVNFNSDTIVPLSGDWEFYWDTLLVSGCFPEKHELGTIPEFWKNYTFGFFPSIGKATYRSVVKLNSAHPLLSFQIGDIHNSYNFYINGELVHACGIVGNNSDQSVAKWIPEIVFLEDTSSTLELVLQVANYKHRNGGVQHPIILGNAKTINQLREGLVLADLFLGGATIVIGLFFFGMYFFWKKDKSALYFGLFCFSFALRVLIVGSRSLPTLLPWLPWEVNIRLEYLSLFLSATFFLYFIYFSFRKQASKLLVNFVTYFYIILIAVTLFLPASIFTYLIFPNNILLLILIIYAFYVYVKAFRSKVFGSGWALLSFVVFFLAVGISLAEYANLISPSPLVLSLGFVAFILTMSLIFASRFGKAFSDVEKLKINAENQKEQISYQHELIKDSIHYAKRIQSALLPKVGDIKEKLPNSFIYYNPQSVVSGDFYWYKYIEKTNEVIIVISDCTGHGVPGAFMSIIGISSLDKIVTANSDVNPSKILEILNGEIRSKLNRGENDEVEDGMDVIVCKINLSSNEIQFASAFHKFVLIRDEKISLINGCRHFIGNEFKEGFSFIDHKIKLELNDQIFMFSDGVYDQKGGRKGRKLYYRGFENILKDLVNIPVDKQLAFLEEQVIAWKGENEQLDDILVFGWKV